jgi:hypothetical protein
MDRGRSEAMGSREIRRHADRRELDEILWEMFAFLSGTAYKCNKPSIGSLLLPTSPPMLFPLTIETACPCVFPPIRIVISEMTMFKNIGAILDRQYLPNDASANGRFDLFICSFCLSYLTVFGTKRSTASIRRLDSTKA